MHSSWSGSEPDQAGRGDRGHGAPASGPRVDSLTTQKAVSIESTLEGDQRERPGWPRISRIMARILALVLLLCLPLMAAIEWTHDLTIYTIDLEYRGKRVGGGVQKHDITVGAPTTALVTVKNNSRNPSVGYKVDLYSVVDPRRRPPVTKLIGSVPGKKLRSGEMAEHRLNWTAEPTYGLVAQIVFTSPLPGGDPMEQCSECRRPANNCSWPSYCRHGAGEGVHSCHNTNDNPANNQGATEVLITGSTDVGTSGPEGIDLFIESASLNSVSAGGINKTMCAIFVANQGTQDHRGSVKVQVKAGSTTRSATISGGIPKGTSKSVSIDVDSTNKSIVVTVDPDNSIKETNENNNTRSAR